MNGKRGEAYRFACVHTFQILMCTIGWHSMNIPQIYASPAYQRVYGKNKKNALQVSYSSLIKKVGQVKCLCPKWIMFNLLHLRDHRVYCRSEYQRVEPWLCVNSLMKLDDKSNINLFKTTYRKHVSTSLRSWLCIVDRVIYPWCSNITSWAVVFV